MAAPRYRDRISGLPDSLLLRILSSLHIRDAVRSSTLSRRWRQLWMLLPSLDFTKYYPPSRSLPKEEATKKAMKMISHVLINSRARPLAAVTLYLPFYSCFHQAFLSWCLTIAVTRRVARLALLLNDCHSLYVLPSFLMARFNHLTHLHLSRCKLPLPDTPNHCFTSLRSLHISCLDVVGAELEMITSRAYCPVLEMLKLTRCNEFLPLTISLSNPSLIYLHVFVCLRQREEMEIAAPHVTHLKLDGSWRKYVAMELSAIVEVNLDFVLARLPMDENEQAMCFPFFHALFTSLPSSAKLHLSPWLLQVLHITKIQELVTSSIKAKEVIVMTGGDFSDIPNIAWFFNSPEIEHLTINMSNKMHLNKNLCHDGCACFKVGLLTQSIDEAGKKYCMLFEQSLLINNKLKTIVLDGFYEECGNIKASKFCSYLCRSWQFEFARIILIKLQKLEKMVLKGRSIHPEVSHMIAEMCCSLPRANSTTIIECWDSEGCSSQKNGVYRLLEPMASFSCDRLSALPNDLLLNVLSFLNLREAICTSILSKRWKRLWTLLPTLDFNEDKFYYHSWMRSEIINNVLAQSKASTLSAFCLNLRWSADAQHDSWIAFALSRHVQRLVLYLKNYELPPYLFYYSNCLTYLELKLCIINLPQLPFSLVSLKTLHIQQMTLEEPGLLERLTSSACCPVLEKLQISGCNSFRPFKINLTNPSISHLCLSEVLSNSLDICASHIARMELLGHWTCIRDIKLKPMVSVKEATFDLNTLYGDHVICFLVNKFVSAFPLQVKLHFPQHIHQVVGKYGGWRVRRALGDTQTRLSC